MSAEYEGLRINEAAEKMIKEGENAEMKSVRAREWLKDHGYDVDFRKMESYLIRKDNTAIDDFYAAGKLAVSIYVNHPDAEASQALKQMGEALGEKYRVIMAARKFAKCFNDYDVEQIKEIKFENGLPPTITHLMMLMVDYIDSPSARIAVLKLAAEKKVPSNKFNKFIQELYGRNPNVTGRKDNVPTTIESLLSQMDKPARDIIRKCDTVWFSTGKKGALELLTTDLGEVTFDIRQELLNVIDTYAELQQKIEALLAILRSQDSPYLDAAIRNNRSVVKEEEEVREEVRVAG